MSLLSISQNKPFGGFVSTQLPRDVFSGLLEATGKHTVNWLYCHLAFLNSSISSIKGYCVI